MYSSFRDPLTDAFRECDNGDPLWALQGDGRGGKGSLDEARVFFRDGELFG